jgi:hypothetical protein
LKDSLSEKGSLSLLTNGSSVLLASLQVRGKLREEWATKEAERRAEAEWQELAAGKPVGGGEPPPEDPWPGDSPR